MITKSNRKVFLGIHLTREIKGKLRLESQRLNVSMSALASQMLGEGLQHVVLPETPDPSGLREIPLPLDT